MSMATKEAQRVRHEAGRCYGVDDPMDERTRERCHWCLVEERAEKAARKPAAPVVNSTRFRR